MSTRSTARRAGESLTAVMIVLAWACLGLMLQPKAARAQTINSNEFVSLPPGTNLALGYYGYQAYGDYNVKGAGTFRDQTGLTANLGVLRYVHFFGVGGYDAAVQIIQPFLSETGGRIGGQALNDASGVGDTTLGFAFWPYSNQSAKTYVALAGYIDVPDGSYDGNRALSVGANRVSGVVQLGLNKGIGDRISIDFAVDGQFYGSNDHAPVTGGRLTQDPSFRAQGFLNYNITPYANVSLGLEGVYGGKQYVETVATGAKTEFERLRVGGSMFLAPTWQVLVELDRDLHTVGGFREDFGATVRVLKVF